MDTEIALSSLANCSLGELHRCFIRAFGDYAVPMDLPLEQFGTMLVRNGFDADLSVGAFHDGQLVGFVFNGVRDNISGKLAYDSGTAVLPRFRGRGIATRLVRYSMDRLAQAGVYGYVLECIASNETALELYRKSGFRQTRHLDCWQAETETLLSHRVDVRSQYQFEPGSTEELDMAQGILSSYPSWQNSDIAIKRIASRLRFIKLTDVRHRIIGFAAWEPTNGTISRLATWDIDAALLMLQYMAHHSETDRMRMMNVDTEDRLLPSVLEELGFSVFVNQVEMLKLLH